jgi:hypothetical protein
MSTDTVKTTHTSTTEFRPDTRYEDGKKITRIPIQDFGTFYGRAKHLYYIRTKDNKLTTYVPNQGQLIIGNIIDNEIAKSIRLRGYPQVWIIILKPRQIGATTDTALRIMDKMLTTNMYQALVTTHVGEDTEIIFDKYKIAYQNLPDFVELIDKDGNVIIDPKTKSSLIPFKPKERSDSAKQLRFADQTEAWVNVRTAGSGDNLGKGGTLNAAHFTEIANYDHFNKVVSSSSQQLPDNGEVYVVMESTANGTTGPGEGFYKTFVKAEAGYNKFLSGQNQSYEGYIPIFVPWYVIDEYQLPLENGEFVDLEGIDFGGPEGRPKFLEKEIMLMTQYDVSPERINWYRYIIKQKCNYSLAEANRYYPTFPEDAFLSTDKCFFDSNKLFSLQKSFDDGSRKLAVTQGYLDEDLTYVQSMGGELKIIEEPDPDSVNRYICSVDTSKGVEDGDFTSMDVFDRVTERWVAHWHGRMAEDLVAKEYVKLCTYYNYALMMPEVNRATVIDMVKPGGVLEYEGPIYFSDITGDNDYKWGFNTLSNTRKLLLDKYKAWLRTNYDKLNLIDDVLEHISFVRVVSSRGVTKYMADTGKKDDRVISKALTIYAHEWWDEEVGFLNKQKTDFTQIVKINNNNHKQTWGRRQSSIGNSNVYVINK